MNNRYLDSWLSAVASAIAQDSGLGGWLGQRASLEAAAEVLEPVSFAPGETLVEQGAGDRDAWIVTEGTVAFEVQEGHGDVHSLHTAAAPSAFGTRAFAVGRTHNLTARAKTPVVAFGLTRRSLQNVAAVAPLVATGLVRWLAADVVHRIVQSRAGNNEERRFVLAFPRRKTLPQGQAMEAASALLLTLRGFPAGTFEPLVPGIGEHIQIVQVAEGDAVVSHGDKERSLLLLLSGTSSSRTTKGRVLGRFTAGAAVSDEVMLGELGFLADVPRDGTVFADSAATFLEISTDALPWLAQTLPDLTFQLHVALLRTVCGRIEQADDARKHTQAITAGHFDSWFDERDE